MQHLPIILLLHSQVAMINKGHPDSSQLCTLKLFPCPLVDYGSQHITSHKALALGRYSIYHPPKGCCLTESIHSKVELSRVHKFAGSMLIFWPVGVGTHTLR
jgi:hypothetical protein